MTNIIKTGVSQLKHQCNRTVCLWPSLFTREYYNYYKSAVVLTCACWNLTFLFSFPEHSLRRTNVSSNRTQQSPAWFQSDWREVGWSEGSAVITLASYSCWTVSSFFSTFRAGETRGEKTRERHQCRRCHSIPNILRFYSPAARGTSWLTQRSRLCLSHLFIHPS